MAVTPNFGATLPDVGGSENNWGYLVNTAFSSFDGAFDALKLKVAYGGTSSGNATDARTALGLGSLSTQDASSLSVGTLITTGNAGIGKTPATDADVNGNIQASSGVTITGASAISGTSTFSGTATADALTANTQLKIPSLPSLVDTSGNRVLGFGCETKLTSDITGITNSSNVNISWNAENFDDASMWSSGYLITLPKAGLYLVTLSLNWTCTSTGDIYIQFISGADTSNTYGVRTVNGGMITTVQHVFYKSSSDTMYVNILNSSGSTGTINATLSNNVTRLIVCCLGTF